MDEPTHHAQQGPAYLATTLVKRHEGYSQFPYPDAHSTIAIGYGTNLTRRGLSRCEAELLMLRDINEAEEFLSSYPWWVSLNDARKAALIDMTYHLGHLGFAALSLMLEALATHRYDDAAQQIECSKWALETPARASRDAMIVRKGLMPTNLICPLPRST